ncbi:MAG TPA: dihydropteroate synthase [Longimicrobiales bacterium]|nr:dihydropteroate synthase [Longimicrobiales bacterium]
MIGAPVLPLLWRTARADVRLERPVIAGVLNVTPDSFWDGGRHAGVEAAVRHAGQMLEDGADIIDVGGESTRPGARGVAEPEERARVVPVIDAIVARWPDVPVSIDTVKSDVARAALDAGAAIINDVSALRIDGALAGLAARTGAGVVLMHSRGGVEGMARYELAEYGDDVVGDVLDELSSMTAYARAAGIAGEAIVLDPGLGFSKRTEHSIAVLAGLPRLAAAGYPLLVGPSRKRFIGEASGGLPAELRLEGTLAACVVALMRGARIFRVHDVAPARRALDLADAVRRVMPEA